MAVLPMFPLGTTLLPGGVLPLHVFEPRYRQLVVDCLQAADAGGEPEFGVTLIARGSEVGGGDVRTTWGTVARIVQVGRTEDGRYAVVAVGVRRARVVAWLPDDPYPLADLDDWPDEVEPVTDADRDLVLRLQGRIRRAAALAVELGDPAPPPVEEVGDDPLTASYRLIAGSPIGELDRHALLCARGPRERLQHLDQLLDDVETLLQLRLHEGGSEPS